MDKSNQGFTIDFTRYYGYQELTDILFSLAEAYPDLAKLYSIGKSHRGRDLWLMEITSKKGGPPRPKPGYYIDANTHAEELVGSMVALYTAWYLMTRYGVDETVTRLLDWQAFYILPRVNPDGAELCLTQPFYQWMGNGRYLVDEQQIGSGLHYADINGDGYILEMRIRNDKGEWKISEKDPRLMIPREPYEYGGEYYRVLPEGCIEDYDGAGIKIPEPRDCDPNRNYPYDWGPEGEERGSGQYPMEEPEIEAVVKFIKAHPNIAGAVNYHTNLGAIVMPFHIKGQPLPLEDEALLKRIAAIGQKETGYSLLSKNEQFREPGKKPRMGTATDFLYGQLGIIAFVTELWDIYTEAGIKDRDYFSLKALSEEDNLKLLKWNDEHLDGKGFMEWTPFEHPQLGEIEIGGWKRLFTFRNPPGQFVEITCHKNAIFTLKHASMAPFVQINDVVATSLGEGMFRIKAIIENQGYLPTNLTKHALELGIAKLVIARIELSEGVELAAGEEELQLGHLPGRSERSQHYSRFVGWNTPGKKAEWAVRLRGVDSGVVRVRTISQKGGEDVRTVALRRDG